MKPNDILAIDREHIWHPYTQESIYHNQRPPLLIEKAEGFFFYDNEKKAYYDGNGSWWTNYLGHSHPDLVQTLTEQLHQYAHVAFAGLTHEAASRCAQSLIDHCPDTFKRVFFSDNGSSSVEVALKMAFQFFHNQGQKEKRKFFSLENAFHGETIGCVSVGGTAVFHELYGPLLFENEHLPSPAKHSLAEALERAEQALQRDHEKTCAVIVEPLIQGVGGMAVYSADYLQGLSEICKKHGIFLIADEVFTGLGRTGTFWAFEQASITPDFICSSKGLSGGLLPFAVTLTTEEVYQAFYGEKNKTFFYGHTYSANPLGCAVASKMIEWIDKLKPTFNEKILSFHQSLKDFEKIPQIKDIRKLGFIAALELDGQGYLDEIGWTIYDQALKNGLYARPLGNVLYLLPMLTMGPEEHLQLSGRLFDATQKALAQKG